MLSLTQLGERAKPLAFPAVALVFGIDVLLDRREPSRPVAGVLDESAHLITSALLLAAWPGPRPDPFLRGALAGAVLIDLDHVPGDLGWMVLAPVPGRPVTHSLPVVGALLLAAAPAPPRRRDLLRGAACGVLLHFLRDLATGGAPLCWPRSARRIGIPYAPYLALLAGTSLRVAGPWRARGDDARRLSP